ncbi:MAG TPA: hypothetical protein VHX62_13935 [Solirubrobacteraceae bacterium]|nr:hypothetical protein [Solirubrobacteraceae bacterium]
MTHDYTLAYGTHATPHDGRCAMEWVSYLAGESHSDQPHCVSPVLRAMCIALNDGLEQGPRQRLRPYLTRTIGTTDDGLDGARAWMAMDWLARLYTPAWLRLAGLHAAADRLAALDPFTDAGTLSVGLTALEEARHEARAARGRAFRAPLPTGWAAGVAASMAGREVAWACAGAAAWAAARVGIGAADGDRARAAARAAAGDAAAIAVRHSRQAAGGGGVRTLARAALAPTVDSLADAALALLDRMLPTEVLTLPEAATAPAGAPAADEALAPV